MVEETHEFTGKTVDEAVAEGLSKLNVSRSEVAVEVLSKGSRGIFGIGSEPARIRITLEPSRQPAATPPAEAATTESLTQETPAPTPALEVEQHLEEVTAEEASPKEAEETPGEVETPPPSPASAEIAEVSDDELETMAAEMLSDVVRLMGFEADVVTSWQDPDGEGSPYLLLDIEGDNLSALIGRRGETLASLQYLIRLMVNQRIKQWRNIVVDVEKYKERRVTQLNQLALRMADQVVESGRAVALEPMPPNERRIVHLALRDHPHVYTQSSGEGDRRKVHIVPKDTV